MKKRFKVLTEQLEYPYAVQVRLVKVICCLHNIIRVTGGDDVFDELWIQTNVRTGSSNRRAGSGVEDAVVYKTVSAAEAKFANALRDKIAEQMWNHYSQYKRAAELIR
jgi:hypothetical protein